MPGVAVIGQGVQNAGIHHDHDVAWSPNSSRRISSARSDTSLRPLENDPTNAGKPPREDGRGVGTNDGRRGGCVVRNLCPRVPWRSGQGRAGSCGEPLAADHPDGNPLNL